MLYVSNNFLYISIKYIDLHPNYSTNIKNSMSQNI